jgi:hypothetical protein
LQYYTDANIVWAEVDKSAVAVAIGTGTFTSGDKVMITGADEAANLGVKTVDVVAANKITFLEACADDADDDHAVFNQIVVSDWFPVDFYSRICGAYATSQNSTLRAEWSVDGSTVIVTVDVAVTGGTAGVYSVEVVAPFVRYSLLNAGTDQTAVAVHLYAKSLT